MKLIHKIKNEVGLHSFRIFPILFETLYRNLSKKSVDYSISDVVNTRIDFKLDESPPIHLTSGYSKNMSWNRISYKLALLSTYEWSRSDLDLDNELSFLSDMPHSSYFRTYNDLVLEKNDFWEWHLIPWHRNYGTFAIAYSDLRLKPYLKNVWAFYDNEFASTKPWMTLIDTGSNIAGVNAGRAFHALLGYIDSGDVFYEKLYQKYLNRFVRSLDLAYDIVDGVSVPHEGVSYGGFLWNAAAYLGVFQKKLGIDSILDIDHIQSYPEYVYLSKTKDGTYQSSGDSYLRYDSITSKRIYTILSSIYENPYAKLIIDQYEPDKLSERVCAKL